MIYEYLYYVLLLSRVVDGFIGFAGTQMHNKPFVGHVLQSDVAFANYVTVKFVNTIMGKDVIVEKVPVGSNLLTVGDEAGVNLPRACRTGLCGSCTCELQTPGTEASSNVERPGFTIIRACSTKCKAPSGMDTMVIDVYRMKSQQRKESGAAAFHVSIYRTNINECFVYNRKTLYSSTCFTG